MWQGKGKFGAPLLELLSPRPDRMQMSAPPPLPLQPSRPVLTLIPPAWRHQITGAPDLDVSGFHRGDGLINQDNAGEPQRSRFLFPAGKSLHSHGRRPLHCPTSSGDKRYPSPL
ncbi:hypothetical protein SKAU_G00114380 [Synaphobranchus kaupii]|uniref:Uncharacterized protein n=1 Tax=Synaphobranchus kaupii TaxID=118154 RepID=A0A9Q1G1W7_SYNKA|nr:hypothetical protein SKAU_G00114380 [Synaphobranchus kaupii]